MMMKDYKGYEIERVTRNTYVIRKGRRGGRNARLLSEDLQGRKGHH